MFRGPLEDDNYLAIVSVHVFPFPTHKPLMPSLLDVSSPVPFSSPPLRNTNKKLFHYTHKPKDLIFPLNKVVEPNNTGIKI